MSEDGEINVDIVYLALSRYGQKHAQCRKRSTIWIHPTETSAFQDNNLDLKRNEFKDYFFNDLITSRPEKLAVFHMISSHFPYQWMYPNEFRHYVPTCPASALDPLECTRDELINSYDNTIVFADSFLSKTINVLRDKNAILVYVSDHGEYLGEHGRYLHGQGTEDAEIRHVPMIWWASDRFIKSNPDKIRSMRSKLHVKLSHDNIFHSVLDCAGIDSPVIDKSLSISN